MTDTVAVRASSGDADSRDPERGPDLTQVGMMIFLASDLMLFAGLFAANFFLRSRTEVWPPAGVKLDMILGTVFTIVLVVSSATMQIGLRAFERHGRVRSLRVWTVATIVLGAAFVANQLHEYATIDFVPSDHAYGSVYWTLTGLHAAHVTVGVLALSVLLVRTTSPAFGRRDLPAASAIGYFWHFVDVVWLAVFVTLFVVR